MNIFMLPISRCDTLKSLGTYIAKKFDHGKKPYDMDNFVVHDVNNP
jgi:hypothetical protein